jgi:hypothetical protein
MLKYVNDKNKIRKYEIDINCKVTQQEVEEELDGFIRARWEEYFICKLGWKETYAPNSKEQEKVLSDMATIISCTISPLLMTRLSRFYNPEKDKDGVSGIDKVIAEKIHIIVLNYSLENSKPTK